MKKKFVPVLTVLLAVIMAAAMVACGDGAKDKYTVSAQFDSEYGTVTVTDADGAVKTDFAAGENAVITVTPKEGYEVASLNVNGTAATLTDGKYTFTVSANTTVVVGFAQKQTGEYTVSVGEYDTEGGTVKVAGEDGAEKSTFTAGENAVVTATPKEGYGLASLKVNGKTVTLTNGKYIFAVSANTTVTAEFAKNQSYDLSKALAAVAVSFKAEGIARYMEDGEDPSTDTILTIFDEGVIYMLEKDAATGEVYYEDLYVDRDGKLAVPSITINNELEYVESDSDFADFDNPFTGLGAEDFTACETAGEFVMTDSDKARSAATAITGWNESIAEFKMIVSYDNIVRIEITTERIAVSGEDDLYYTTLYVFTVSDWGTAEVDMTGYVPFEHLDAHDDLAAALEATASASNYKLHIDEPATADEPAVEYDVYVTETAVYIDLAGEENGYVEVSGQVYPFSYDPETETVTATDPLGGYGGMADMRATFDGFAHEIFEYKGNGVYELRGEAFVKAVLASFADWYDVRMLASYAYGPVVVTIKDGMLYSVEYNYYVYGLNLHRIVTYGEYDATELPVSLENMEFKSILEAYYGTYSDGTHTAVITGENGIVIDGQLFTMSYHQVINGVLVFTGTWKGETYYLQKQTQKQILLFNEDANGEVDEVYTLNSTAADPVEVPGEFIGVWSGDGHKVVITDEKAYFDAYTLKLLSYGEDEGLTAVYGSVTYNFSFYKEELVVLVIENGDVVHAYACEKDDEALVISDLFVGTFEGEDTYLNKSYKATISQVGITVVMDGATKTATVKEIKEEQSFGGTYLAMYVLIDGKEYVFSEGYGNGQLNFGSEFDNYASVSVTLNRVDEGGDEPPAPGGDIPSSLHGTYTKTEDGVTSTVVIGADYVSVNLGGEEKEVTFIGIDEYNEIEIEIDGVSYFIMDMSYKDVSQRIMMYTDDGFMLSLDRTAGGDQPPVSDVEIPEAFAGKFEGEKDGVTYTVVITEDGIAVSFNGVAKTVVIVEYDDYEGFTVTLDGDEYCLMNGEYTDEVNSVRLMTSDWTTLNVVLDRADEGGGEEPPAGNVEIPADFIGTFEGEDEVGGSACKVVISENNVEVYIGGVKKEATIEKVEDGYYGFDLYIIIDDVEYVFNYGFGSYGLGSAADYGASFSASLTKSTTTGDEIPEAYIGKFEGENEDGVKYTVVITADGIAVSVDGVAKTVVITEFDDFEGFTLTIDGVEYYISQSGYGDEINKIGLMPASNIRDYVTLDRVTEGGGEEPPAGDVEIPEAFYGEYATSTWSYMISIDETGIYLATMAGGGNYDKVEIVSYDKHEGFTLLIDGETYYLTNSGYTDEVNGLAFMSEDLRTVNVVLDRVED